MIKKLFFITLLSFCCVCVSAQNVQEVQDSVKIYFKQGKIDLLPDFKDNQKALKRISDSLTTSYADSIYQLQRVLIIGGASPEGGVNRNKWLSEKRAAVLFDYLSRYRELPDSLRSTVFLGRDWRGLIRLVQDDPKVPYKEETLDLLNGIADEVDGKIPSKGEPLGRIQQLRGGVPYSYMYKNLFPELRASSLHLWYEKVLGTIPPEIDTSFFYEPVDTTEVEQPVDTTTTVVEETETNEWVRRLYIKSNALGWVVGVANFAGEIDIAKHWSFTLPVYWSTWNYFKTTIKFRVFAIQPEVRYWFSEESNDGFFLGAHFGMAYYNIATNGDYRYQDHNRETPALGGGIGLGYRMPFKRNNRWGMEFTLGAGVYSLNYDKLYNTSRTKDGKLAESGIKKTYWGIDQAAVTFYYSFDLKKKGGK